MLKMPREVFGWKDTFGYFANVGIAGDALYLEVRGFDGPARKTMDPGELDWCIPLAYDAAPEIERLGWKIGWGEGWSDSMLVARLRFGPEFRSFFADVLKEKRLAIATDGEQTASLLLQLDRNLKTIARFVES